MAKNTLHNELTVRPTFPPTRIGDIPQKEDEIRAVMARCRKMVTRRALISAGVSLLPLPGADVAVDVSLLISILDRINQEFGLSAKQISELSTENRAFVFNLITVAGSSLIGQLLTKQVVLAVLKKMSIQLTAAQAAKIVPVIGLGASACISFGALKIIGNQHIEECAKVARMITSEQPPEPA